MKIANAVLAGSIGLTAALPGISPAQTQSQPVRNIVLVHGAFADGTSWGKVIPILEARGFHVVAVQNPLTSLSDDAKRHSPADRTSGWTGNLGRSLLGRCCHHRGRR